MRVHGVHFFNNTSKKIHRLHKFDSFSLKSRKLSNCTNFDHSFCRIQKVFYKNDWIWFRCYKHFQCEWVFLKIFAWFATNILKIFIDMHFIILYRKILSSLVLNSCYHYKRANIFLIDILDFCLRFFYNFSQIPANNVLFVSNED